MARSLDVGIVGAGTGGSAAALFLARAGHRVTLYERVEHPSPVGAGILLQPTGQAVLARLGLLGVILGRGARIERLRCRSASGRQIFD
ncbi:MAG: FAD-dependent oxidoreductase, partial [Deltaproteobacteria bacterium]